MTDIRTFFQKTAQERTLEIDDEIVNNDKQHEELMEDKERLYKAIKDALPDNCKNLMDEYDEKLCEARRVAEVIIYMQAFKDCKEIMTWLAK